MPRHPLDEREYSDEEKGMLDTVGNIALIAWHSNPKFSNLSPEQKVNEAHKDDWHVVSLKYELMLQIAASKGCDAAACKEHGEAMKRVLANSFQPPVASI